MSDRTNGRWEKSWRMRIFLRTMNYVDLEKNQLDWTFEDKLVKAMPYYFLVVVSISLWELKIVYTLLIKFNIRVRLLSCYSPPKKKMLYREMMIIFIIDKKKKRKEERESGECIKMWKGFFFFLFLLVRTMSQLLQYFISTSLIKQSSNTYT